MAESGKIERNAAEALAQRTPALGGIEQAVQQHQRALAAAAPAPHAERPPVPQAKRLDRGHSCPCGRSGAACGCCRSAVHPRLTPLWMPSARITVCASKGSLATCSDATGDMISAHELLS